MSPLTTTHFPWTTYDPTLSPDAGWIISRSQLPDIYILPILISSRYWYPPDIYILPIFISSRYIHTNKYRALGDAFLELSWPLWPLAPPILTDSGRRLTRLLTSCKAADMLLLSLVSCSIWESRREITACNLSTVTRSRSNMAAICVTSSNSYVIANFDRLAKVYEVNCRARIVDEFEFYVIIHTLL